MIVAGIIVFIILVIIAVKMIVTAINSNSQKAMAEEENKGYTMVDSTELGEDGKPLQVPVPDGFTASQVPGETTVNGGFVIYEGEVDWSKIEDLDSYAEVEATAEEAEEGSTENSNTDSSNSENNENSEEVNIENNNTDTPTTNEGNSEEVAEEEQSQDLNSEQAGITEDLQKNSQENVTSEENEISQEQIEEENTQEEERDTEPIDNIEEKSEELEQAKNEIIKEEEPISDGNEEAEIATMSGEENGGIVTLAEGETPRTVFELQTSRNQYVWVPVKDVSRIYGVDSKGKLWGKLYNYARTTLSRSPKWSESNGVMNKPHSATYREPDVTNYRSNDDVDGKLQGYRDGIERYQMQSQEMEEKFYEMIESVKKYGGFYIGRYETGDLGEEKAVVKKMNEELGGYINDTYITWYVMYEKCKNLEGEKENIETSMIWGSLWDETLQWLLESGAQIQDGEGGTREITESDINDDSSDWGNYTDATFEYRTTSGGTSTKNEGSYTRIPTGSTEYTKANNIYDLAGNVCDWTLEAYAANARIYRGGDSYDDGSNLPAGYRNFNEPTYRNDSRGCRSALYIK